ncbi:enoyl-CoA hydratase/isomerase family protein [Kaistia dalseonensis]|uniref:Enoyl-CoA hydratase/carnithine racemase n=1 Tax=Kaistia dalseonensis TaxID=410840 RepID=A0ABU0HDG1_9HYPH|nr:enoyl-CoA hydratase/isomerase family protein [Kaistia dalseonensis]MCX5497698.1 enoyl-CoA hydratase/isomerase family protein [Kaistia dalseonensis]MDQ0440342.1 enoyl-CoA hydratase/carnithine racemase [Kaistia dalseonensis]
MAETRIRSTIEGPVAILTLDRPEKLNALDQDMIGAIEDWAEATERNKSIRVAIITGNGEKAFSAGGDIAAWAGLDPISFMRDWIRTGHRVFDRLARLRQPLIAALNGHAFGGGLELAATADIIILEEHGRMGLPETGLAMVPGWSGTQRLVRRFGPRLVKRMTLTGEMFSAADALAKGMVDQIVPKGQSLGEALRIAEKIAARGPVAVQVAKQLVNAAEGEEQATALEAIAGALVAYTDDLKEGAASFREKRPALYEDR